MVTDRETTRIVRSWLVDGRTALPDHVLDAVLDQLPATRQRRSPWSARRFADMTTFAKFASAAAAVVLIAVLGIGLLPGVGPGGDPEPTPTPTITPTPTTTPTPVTTSPPMGVGPIAPGRYAWVWPEGRVSLDVTEGWTVPKPGDIVRGRDTPAEIGLANWLPGTPTVVSRVYDDACATGATLVDIGGATADLVAALEDQTGTSATVTDIEIGGLPASRIDLVVDPAIDPATCRMGAGGPIQIWNQAQSGYLAMFPASDGTYGQAVVWSVDVDGDRLIFTSVTNADTDPADFAAIEAMIASMAFE